MKKFAVGVLTASLFLSLPAFAQETREVTKTVPLAKDGLVSVDTYKGSVNVETWDRGEVSIVAKIEADGWMGREEEKVRDTEILIDASSDIVRIKTDYRTIERRRSFWDFFEGDAGNLPLVHYTIKMPATAKLRIKDYKSETSVRDLRSDMEINTYKGSVEVRSLTGGLDLETYKGECRVEFASMAAESRFETYKGDIRISLPSNAAFYLDAAIGRRGEFDADFQYEGSSSRRSRNDHSFRGDVNGGGPKLRLKTDKGSFRLVKQ